jgi:hypothetical protein
MTFLTLIPPLLHEAERALVAVVSLARTCRSSIELAFGGKLLERTSRPKAEHPSERGPEKTTGGRATAELK